MLVHIASSSGRFIVKVAVVALGKIGLPLAVQLADCGQEGVDVNSRQVELINAATEPFPGEAHLQEKLSALVPSGKLRATTDYSEAIPGADAVVIVVPLFVDDATGKPDFAWIDAQRPARWPRTSLPARWSPTRRPCPCAPCAPASCR